MGKLDRIFKKPVVVKPTEPVVIPDKTVQIVVRDKDTDNPIEHASVGLEVKSGGVFKSTLTNSDGIAVLVIPPAIRHTHLVIQRKDYKTIDQSIILPVDSNVSLDYNLVRNFETTKALSIHDTDFLAGGSLIRLQGISAFPLLQYYIEGDVKKVHELFDFARSIGANLVRIFGEIGWTNFDPSNYSDYYDHLDEFFTLCKYQGFYVDYNCFAMAERYKSLQQARLHVARTSIICGRHDNVLFTLANEPFKNLPKDTTVYDFAGDINCPNWNYGASGEPKAPYIPSGTFVSEHTPRDAEWYRKSKHAQETQEVTGTPDLLAEPMGAIDIPGTGTSQERDANSRHFLEYFATASLFGSSVFHSEKLKFGLVPLNNEYECARLAGLAWKSIPIKFMRGHYTAMHIDDCPIKQSDKVMKVYAMVLGNQAFATLTEPASDYKIETKDGWRVKNIIENCIVELER